MDDETMRAVRSRLMSYGVTLTDHNSDATHVKGTRGATLEFGPSSILVRVLPVSPMTLSGLTRANLRLDAIRDAHVPALVVGRVVHEKTAATFRAMGIWFADTAGNAYVRSADVLIDVRGRRPRSLSSRTGGHPDQEHTPHSANLFSAGRAQVVTALLTWPDLAAGPVRKVAAAAGVSTGRAHSALALLEQVGYLHEGALREDRVDELLDLWAAAYPQGLGSKLDVASYDTASTISEARDEVLRQTSDDNGTDMLELSGESVPGLGLTTPLDLIVYTQDWDPRCAVRHRWRAAATRADAQVHIRRRFWTDPRDEETGKSRAPVAPWPVVYADLLATNDPRLTEVAKDWRDRHRAR